MKTETHLLPRIFRILPAGICLCLMAWVSVTSTMATGVSCDDWNTPMFFLGADTTDISRCLKAGADPNSRNILNGETPLHAAAAFSKTPVVVKALLDAGANPNARNVHAATPLHAAAVLSKNPSVVAVLVKAGAKVTARNDFGKTPLTHGGTRQQNTSSREGSYGCRSEPGDKRQIGQNALGLCEKEHRA